MSYYQYTVAKARLILLPSGARERLKQMIIVVGGEETEEKATERRKLLSPSLLSAPSPTREEEEKYQGKSWRRKDLNLHS